MLSHQLVRLWREVHTGKAGEETQRWVRGAGVGVCSCFTKEVGWPGEAASE